MLGLDHDRSVSGPPSTNAWADQIIPPEGDGCQVVMRAR